MQSFQKETASPFVLETANVLDVEVSAFANYMETEPRPVNLLTWLTSAKYADQVEAIRQTEDKKERDALKAQLPAITPSGLFSRREAAALVKHSGLIQFDIDFADNTHIANFGELKAQLCRLKNVAYCGLSVSGRGYWGLIPIAYPERHKQHFEALKADFAKWKITLDDKPGNVASLRGYSYDAAGYFNHQAKTYFHFIEPKPERYTSRPSHFPAGDEARKVEAILQQAEAGRIDITGSYSAWFEVGCSLANEFGEAGRDYFQRASQYYPGYSVDGTDKQFTHCLRRRYRFSIGTFYRIAEQYGLKWKDALGTPQDAHQAQKKAKPTQQQERPAERKERPQAEANAPTPRAEDVQAKENGFTGQQEGPDGQEDAEQPEALALEEDAAQEAGDALPAGFRIVGNVLEVDGLPMAWLNDEEKAQAAERMKGRELEIMAMLNPNVAHLVERFGLEVN